MSDTDKQTPHVDIMRSQLGQARGLGSARRGSGHWWMQRLTAIALVPLSLWFIYNVVRLSHGSADDVHVWLAGPVPIVLMICLVIATFYHLQLGLQVVIEDYIHEGSASLIGGLAMKAAAVVLALACIVAVLKLGL